MDKAPQSLPAARRPADRVEWLARVRETARDRYDRLHSDTYDEHWGEIGETHREFVRRVAESCPPDGSILDAACGTGKYFGPILESGRTVVGVDQSAGMLAQARAKFPDVRLERMALQELTFDRAFDAVICVDAMENVPPEEWPAVVANLRRAVRESGLVYLTVEKADPDELAESMQLAREAGLPIVDGEDAAPAGGYHYYPPIERVVRWIEEAGLELVDQVDDGAFYCHFLTKRLG